MIKETLTVERKRYSSYHIETTLRDKNGKVKAIFNSMLNQIKRGTKEININGSTFLLDWENVPQRKNKKKI